MFENAFKTPPTPLRAPAYPVVSEYLLQKTGLHCALQHENRSTDLATAMLVSTN